MVSHKKGHIAVTFYRFLYKFLQQYKIQAYIITASITPINKFYLIPFVTSDSFLHNHHS